MPSQEYLMPAGRLRHRIIVEKATESRSAHGDVERSWATFATVWAEIRPLNSREAVEALQVREQVTHFIKLRELSGLTPSMRVKHGSRVFNITGIRDIDERGKVQVLTAVEVVP